jgi:3-oxoacyl-[acyl-carrier-protein] synthase III
MTSASILGLGHELPPLQAVGAAQRPIVASPCGPSELALAAAGPALAEAGWTVDSVQMIVFATMTPDVTFPGAGCFLQDKLGADTIGALDVRGQCAGYVMGLAVANDLIVSGKYERVLLASAEVHSSGFDPSPAGLAIASLYGDAGAATAVGGSGGIATVAAVTCGADGRFYDRFWSEFPSSRRYPTRVTLADLEAGKHYLKIDREHVSQFGREKLPESIRETLAARDARVDDVDLFVLSHVFPEVAQDAARALSLPADRVVVASAERGHLTAASLPIALNLARDAGRVSSGARVCLAACGAGYAWGSALLEFA